MLAIEEDYYYGWARSGRETKECYSHNGVFPVTTFDYLKIKATSWHIKAKIAQLSAKTFRRKPNETLGTDLHANLKDKLDL